MKCHLPPITHRRKGADRNIPTGVPVLNEAFVVVNCYSKQYKALEQSACCWEPDAWDFEFRILCWSLPASTSCWKCEFSRRISEKQVPFSSAVKRSLKSDSSGPLVYGLPVGSRWLTCMNAPLNTYKPNSTKKRISFILDKNLTM